MREDRHLHVVEPSRPRPKLKKLRLFFILLGLGVLALISTGFGMMMAIAADLPAIENSKEFRAAKTSVLLDRTGRRELGIVSQRNRILIRYGDISPSMRHAIIAIEDQRFYDNEGVDFQGIARALWADVTAGQAVQGGSTIPQQLVKNALAAEDDRTVLQKMREAALAHHLTRKWSKQKILTEYLNRIYFGNGAYGIEQAARTYFGRLNRCGQRGQPLCASTLRPEQAAMVAGLVASPTDYDPLARPRAAKRRRNQVLANMVQQRYITQAYYDKASGYALPSRRYVALSQEVSRAPYFTSWVKQQVVDRFGAQRAFEGGLRVRTTNDLELQDAVQEAINAKLAQIGPSAAVVVLENRTGEVRAMAQGPAPPGGVVKEYNRKPFNLSTQGQRQPGSAFKPFVLAAALRAGISPDSTWESKKQTFTVPGTGGKEKFRVNNYEDNYSGQSTLARATTFSDNSVYAQVGIQVGTRKIAKLAKKMGIRTKVSSNYALTLGGLKEGVTPLDMAHAYETLAQRGKLVSGTLAPSRRAPVGIEQVRDDDGEVVARNHRKERRVLDQGVADTASSILETVLTDGTAANAAIDGFAAGKTGTTENYGDAWFVGYDDHYTVAVWVGYDSKLKPMKTEYGGQPVAGGTYPAEIWHDVITRAREMYFAKHPGARERERQSDPLQVDDGTATPDGTAPAPDGSTPAPSDEQSSGEEAAPDPSGPAPEPAPEPEPAPTPAAPASPSAGADGGGGGTDGGGAAPTG